MLESGDELQNLSLSSHSVVASPGGVCFVVFELGELSHVLIEHLAVQSSLLRRKRGELVDGVSFRQIGNDCFVAFIGTANVALKSLADPKRRG